MGDRRHECPTKSVVLNDNNNRSVSVRFDTMGLPDGLRENRGRLS